MHLYFLLEAIFCANLLSGWTAWPPARSRMRVSVSPYAKVLKTGKFTRTLNHMMVVFEKQPACEK